jgi:hypothetical protein
LQWSSSLILPLLPKDSQTITMTSKFSKPPKKSPTTLSPSPPTTKNPPNQKKKKKHTHTHKHTHKTKPCLRFKLQSRTHPPKLNKIKRGPRKIIKFYTRHATNVSPNYNSVLCMLLTLHNIT